MTLPTLPRGYVYLIDEGGNYVLDQDGNYVIVEGTIEPQLGQVVDRWECDAFGRFTLGSPCIRGF